MTIPIKLKRGAEEDVPSLELGELAYTTDTKKLLIGNGIGFTVLSTQDLFGGQDTALHFHSADRARANHTGTQTTGTISDFTTSVNALIAAAQTDFSGEVLTFQHNTVLQSLDSLSVSQHLISLTNDTVEVGSTNNPTVIHGTEVAVENELTVSGENVLYSIGRTILTLDPWPFIGYRKIGKFYISEGGTYSVSSISSTFTINIQYNSGTVAYSKKFTLDINHRYATGRGGSITLDLTTSISGISNYVLDSTIGVLVFDELYVLHLYLYIEDVNHAEVVVKIINEEKIGDMVFEVEAEDIESANFLLEPNRILKARQSSNSIPLMVDADMVYNELNFFNSCIPLEDTLYCAPLPPVFYTSGGLDDGPYIDYVVVSDGTSYSYYIYPQGYTKNSYKKLSTKQGDKLYFKVRYYVDTFFACNSVFFKVYTYKQNYTTSSLEYSLVIPTIVRDSWQVFEDVSVIESGSVIESYVFFELYLMTAGSIKIDYLDVQIIPATLAENQPEVVNNPSFDSENNFHVTSTVPPTYALTGGSSNGSIITIDETMGDTAIYIRDKLNMEKYFKVGYGYKLHYKLRYWMDSTATFTTFTINFKYKYNLNGVITEGVDSRTIEVLYRDVWNTVDDGFYIDQHQNITSGTLYIEATGLALGTIKLDYFDAYTTAPEITTQSLVETLPDWPYAGYRKLFKVNFNFDYMINDIWYECEFVVSSIYKYSAYNSTYNSLTFYLKIYGHYSKASNFLMVDCYLKDRNLSDYCEWEDVDVIAVVEGDRSYTIEEGLSFYIVIPDTNFSKTGFKKIWEKSRGMDFSLDTNDIEVESFADKIEIRNIIQIDKVPIVTEGFDGVKDSYNDFANPLMYKSNWWCSYALDDTNFQYFETGGADNGPYVYVFNNIYRVIYKSNYAGTFYRHTVIGKNWRLYYRVRYWVDSTITSLENLQIEVIKRLYNGSGADYITLDYSVRDQWIDIEGVVSISMEPTQYSIGVGIGIYYPVGGGVKVDYLDAYAFPPINETKSVTFIYSGTAVLNDYIIPYDATNGYVFDETITITGATIIARTPPSGSSINLALYRGTSFLQYISLSDGLSIEQNSLSQEYTTSDKLSLKITQVGSSTSGSDITVILHYETTYNSAE